MPLGQALAKAAKGLSGITDDLSPLAKIGLGGSAAVAGASLALPPLRALATDPTGDEIETVVRQRQASTQARMRLARLQKSMAENTARLAASSPKLYNELTAGRRLPRGAVSFGRPRTDILEEIAMMMSSGDFSKKSPEEEAMDLLTR